MKISVHIYIKKKPKTDFRKFVDYCNRNDIKYFKYKNNFNWIGPAFIIDEESQVSLEDIKNETNIELKYEEFKLNNYLIYPKKFEVPNSIEYPYQMPNFNDEDNEESDETIVIEWIYKGILYYCDEDTGNLYNTDEEYVGARYINNGNFIINFN